MMTANQYCMIMGTFFSWRHGLAGSRRSHGEGLVYFCVTLFLSLLPYAVEHFGNVTKKADIGSQLPAPPECLAI